MSLQPCRNLIDLLTVQTYSRSLKVPELPVDGISSAELHSWKAEADK